MLGNWPQRQGGEEGQRGDDKNYGQHHHAEGRGVGGQGARAFGDVLFAGQQAGDGHWADDGQKA